jgi:hypothetical protein
MKPKKCHARESGHPENKKKNWIPAFAGMTTLDTCDLNLL